MKIGVAADLRVDTGLAFWFSKAVPLAQARRLTFCGDHTACLILEQKNNISRHINGNAQSLLPGELSRPVCTLDQFRPGMTMNDVCSLLEPDPPGTTMTVLTSLGFRGHGLGRAPRAEPVLERKRLSLRARPPGTSGTAAAPDRRQSGRLAADALRAGLCSLAG